MTNQGTVRFIGPACCRTSDHTALPRTLKLAENLAAEFAGGLNVLKAGNARDGAARFAEGNDRRGKF